MVLLAAWPFKANAKTAVNPIIRTRRVRRGLWSLLTEKLRTSRIIPPLESQKVAIVSMAIMPVSGWMTGGIPERSSNGSRFLPRSAVRGAVSLI